MTHLRLWRFEVSPESQRKFVAAYEGDGDWARLFAAAPGFIRTELWRDESGNYVTADHWRSRQDFDNFQQVFGDRYRALDAALQELSVREEFIAALDLVC